nr:cobalamin-dependent protein [Bacteroidales bacterium]
MTVSQKLVVLVQPSHDTWDRLFVRIPESLLAIAALPVKNGYKVVIIDQRINSNWKKELAAWVMQKPICVGITTLTGPSISHALDAAEIVKSIDADCKVVFGGVHVTLLPEQSLLHPCIDIVLKGEGDYVFDTLLKALENKTDLHVVEGIYFKENGQIVSTPNGSLITNMGDLPDYPYHLIDMSKYSAMDIENGKSVSFQTSRGCPFSCNFCGNPQLNQNTWRAMPIAKIVSKIEILQSVYGFNNFLFLD